MEKTHILGGFTVVKTTKGRIYMYTSTFYGNWKLYPPIDQSPVLQFKSEDEVIEYLKDK